MNAITRFFSLGLQDADRRVAAALTPQRLEPVDRYLADSAIVRSIDRATHHLQAWWFDSDARRAMTSIGESVSGQSWVARYRGIAAVLLVAVVVNLLLTLIQGARPGWFWLVIPVMTAVFALLLLAGSRSPASTP